MDAPGRLSGLRHAGGLHDAGGRFCRSRETVNVLMECIVDTCLCGVLFSLRFTFMFSHGNGLIWLPLVLFTGRAGHI